MEDIESKLGDIKCGRRPTSCSGQLAIAVRKAYDGLLKPAVGYLNLLFMLNNKNKMFKFTKIHNSHLYVTNPQKST